MSLSLTLNKSKKVEYHIRMKTYKTIVLRFWVKGWCQYLLCRLNSCLIDVICHELWSLNTSY